MTPSRVHARLRHETAELHVRVEARIDIPRRLATPASYAALLGRFLGFVEPAEAMLARAAWPACAAFNARRRAPLLEQDLRALGFGAAQMRALPRTDAVPAAATLAGAYGWLYVLERSTLGGRLILREVGKALGPAVAGATGYFAGHGPGTGAMWTAFLASLAAYASSCACEDEVVAGAAECFAALDAWFASA